MCEGERTRSTLRYGIDAPPVVAAMAIGGFAALAIIVAGGPALPLLIASASCLATVALMLHSSLRGKLHERDRMLDGLELKGAERLLDLGCGRGLLVLGAAHRLPRGRVTGIDRWSRADQSGNSRAATLANAHVEAVADRLDLVDGDLRDLPFPSAGFDVVVAGLSLHNIHGAGRRRAVAEAIRVLAPGGRIALLDFRATGQYAQALRDAHLTDVERSPRHWGMYPPTRVVTGRRPA